MATSIDATKKIKFDLFVDPKGKIRPIPLQHHTNAPNIFVRERGRLQLSPLAQRKGWATLASLYTAELEQDLTDARRTDLENGRDYILTQYMPAAIRGEPLSISLNPPDRQSSSTTNIVPEHLLPAVVVRRRKATRDRAHRLQPPPAATGQEPRKQSRTRKPAAMSPDTPPPPAHVHDHDQEAADAASKD